MIQKLCNNKEVTRKMPFQKNKHSVELFFKQHKILNFEKQKTLPSASFMWRIENNITEQFSLNEGVLTKISNFMFPVQDQTY